MVDFHPFVTQKGTLKEAYEVIDELKKRQIKNHLALAKSDNEFKEKVDRVLKDVQTEMKKLQKDIRNEVDKPTTAYNSKKAKDLNMQRTQLSKVQDELLKFITPK